MSQDALCIALRFRPEFSSEQWARTLAGLLAWEPALRPTHVHRRDDSEALPLETWADDLWPELAHRLAEKPSWSWGLEHRDGSSTSLDIGRGLHQNDALIAVDRPGEDVVEYFLKLLDAVRGGAEPALAMLYDCSSEDAEFVLQGLHRLEGVPPVLYLDERALQRVGGKQHVLRADGRIVEAPHGGLIIQVRDPWRPPTRHQEQTAAQVGRVLGIGPTGPVSFLDSVT